MRNSFIFYSSYYEAISELPDEEQGLIYKAIIDYGIAKKEPKKLTPACKMCFRLIRPTIDAALSRYDASVENGKKGGAPKGNSNAQKQPKNNPKTTQNQPRNNLDQTQKQAKNNLDMDMDIQLVNHEYKNKFDIDYQQTCGRVRERSEEERSPYIKFYADYFYPGLIDPWKSVGYEIVDTMIEAHDQATINGLKFNKNIIGGKDLAKTFANVNVDQFRAIATQMRFNLEVKNRPYYILGAIINAAKGRRNVMTERMETFEKEVEGKL